MPIGAAIAGLSAVKTAVTLSAQKKAAKAAKRAADDSIALQKEVYGQSKENLQPYIVRGNTAGDSLSALLGLGADPAAAKQAFNNYLNSTGYQFQLDQSLRSVAQNRAFAGLLDSGSALKAAQKNASDLSSGYFN